MMNSVFPKILRQQVGVGLSSMLAVAAVILAPPEVLRADDHPVTVLTQFSISGFQADSSSPLVLNGDLVGTGAIWKHIDGPVLGTTVGMTSSPSGGAVFQVEYSQDQIVTQDGGTITVNLYGIRSTPYGSAGGHITNGAYDIVGGTGRFEGIIGTGTVTIDVRADGSVRFILGGALCRKE